MAVYRARPQICQILAAAALLMPALAPAVMAPAVYGQARNDAMFHVQVRVLSVNGPAKTPGDCAITGEIARIFRDKPGKLRQGMRVAFTISCRKPADAVIIGGTLWTDYDNLLNAQYLEVFLNSNERGYEVALWQSQIIEKATEQPLMK
jgi:hypothetical protein